VLADGIEVSATPGVVDGRDDSPDFTNIFHTQQPRWPAPDATRAARNGESRPR
jgi:hypothetical protein